MSKRLIVAVIWICCIMGTSAQNLLQNPGFEEGLKNWRIPQWKSSRPWLVPTIDQTVFHGPGGSHSMRLDYKKDDLVQINYLEYGKSFPVTPGVYTLSFWAKSTGYDFPTRGQLFASVKLPEIKKTISKMTPWDRMLDDWTFFSEDVTIPSGCTKAILYFGLHGYKNTKGTTWVDDVYFGPKNTAPVPVVKKEAEVKLLRAVSAASHGGIYYPGEKIEYLAEFHSVKKSGSTAVLDWEIQNFDGKTIASGKQNILLPQNASPDFVMRSKKKVLIPSRVAIPLNIPDSFRGWFAVKMNVSAHDVSLASVTGSGIIVDPIHGKRDPFFASNNGYPMEKRIRMGIGSGEVHAQKRYLEKGFNQYDFTKFDKGVDHYVQAGMEPVISVSFQQNSTAANPLQPPWLRKKVDEKLAQGQDPYDEAYYDSWRKYFQALVRRYGDRVHIWCVTDEIYHTYTLSKYELPHYLKLSKMFSEIIRKNNPKDRFFGGGCFMDMSPIGKVTWENLKGYLDGLCCSIYLQRNSVGAGYTINGPEAGGMLKRFQYTSSIIGKNTPIINSETGYAVLMYCKIWFAQKC